MRGCARAPRLSGSVSRTGACLHGIRESSIMPEAKENARDRVLRESGDR